MAISRRNITYVFTYKTRKCRRAFNFSPAEPGPVYKTLIEGVGTGRQAVETAWDQLKDARTATENFYQTGKAHTQGKRVVNEILKIIQIAKIESYKQSS